MGSKRKQTQMRQMEHFERRVKQRVSLLSERGTESSDIDKDAFVKKLRASIRAINNRLKAIEIQEKKIQDLAKKKAEKAAPPPKAPEEAKEKEPKKETKKAPKEGKEKEGGPASKAKAA